MPDGIRVRFCPSPTGNPHVGLIRTALFNWAYARHTGGTFVFRIEDTDAARDSEESYLALLDAMRWLGLDWDEGPEVGGPHAPYRQSQRAAVYADVAARLRDGGHAYDCFCTPEEVAARHTAAGRPANLGYDGHCRSLDPADAERLRADGRAPSLRLRMPDRTIAWDDLVRGELSFEPEHVPDYVLVRANGQPLYTLVNPVDDALMEITHVLRGEDLLSSTPRQIALYEALAAVGVGTGATPAFGHLPYVVGEGNKKLSKRDPTSSLQVYRDEGYLPEALLNYLALLGWSAGEEERFSLAEMVERFDVADVQKNPARFDVKKLRALNGDHIRMLEPAEFGRRLTAVLQSAGLVGAPPSAEQQRLVDALVPLVQTRLEVLGQAPPMVAFLFVDDDDLEVDPAAAATALVGETVPQLEAAARALEDLPAWTVEAVEAALRAALVDGLGLRPKAAFPPLYVAVMGRRSGPPLFDSLVLLGRERSLARLRRALVEVRGW